MHPNAPMTCVRCSTAWLDCPDRLTLALSAQRSAALAHCLSTGPALDPRQRLQDDRRQPQGTDSAWRREDSGTHGRQLFWQSHAPRLGRESRPGQGRRTQAKERHQAAPGGRYAEELMAFVVASAGPRVGFTAAGRGDCWSGAAGRGWPAHAPSHRSSPAAAAACRAGCVPFPPP